MARLRSFRWRPEDASFRPSFVECGRTYRGRPFLLNSPWGETPLLFCE